VLFNSRVGVRIRFSVWSVGCYAHVFCATLGRHCHIEAIVTDLSRPPQAGAFSKPKCLTDNHTMVCLCVSVLGEVYA